MISAEEARKRAFEIHHGNEMEYIERAILSAVDDGVDYIYSSTISKLKELGYELCYCDGGQREPDVYKIEWGE